MPDGYQFVLGSSATLAQNQALYKQHLFYDAASDFGPVALVADSARLLFVRKSLPVTSLAELISYARLNQANMHMVWDALIKASGFQAD
jgi:tripartite-type tricarboxylate transporter receptor subunit TctC